MARSPLSVLQILGFDMKLAVRKDFAGRAYFSHAIGGAFHILVRDEFAIFRLKSASRHKAIGGEIVKGNGFMRLIPDQQGFAAVGWTPIIDDRGSASITRNFECAPEIQPRSNAS